MYPKRKAFQSISAGRPLTNANHQKDTTTQLCDLKRSVHSGGGQCYTSYSLHPLERGAQQRRDNSRARAGPRWAENHPASEAHVELNHHPATNQAYISHGYYSTTVATPSPNQATPGPKLAQTRIYTRIKSLARWSKPHYIEEDTII